MKSANCEECGREVGKHCTYLHGHLVCGYCKRRTSFPHILGIHNTPKGNVKWENQDKPKRNRYNSYLDWDEKKFLYKKHIKYQSEEESRAAIALVLASVKNSRLNK